MGTGDVAMLLRLRDLCHQSLYSRIRSCCHRLIRLWCERSRSLVLLDTRPGTPNFRSGHVLQQRTFSRKWEIGTREGRQGSGCGFSLTITGSGFGHGARGKLSRHILPLQYRLCSFLNHQCRFIKPLAEARYVSHALLVKATVYRVYTPWRIEIPITRCLLVCSGQAQRYLLCITHNADEPLETRATQYWRTLAVTHRIRGALCACNPLELLFYRIQIR